jgi:hypothetical protein
MAETGTEPGFNSRTSHATGALTTLHLFAHLTISHLGDKPGLRVFDLPVVVRGGILHQSEHLKKPVILGDFLNIFLIH